jgi:hypothetical protein
MNLDARIRRLEGAVSPPAPSAPRRTTLDEIRELEAEVRDLEREISAAGGTPDPEPPHVSWEDLGAIEREIAALEHELETEGR